MYKTPKLLFIALGDSCNANCKYCIERTKERVSSPINKNLYSFIRKVNEEYGIQAISFYGGEPTLYFNQIKEIIEELSEDRIRFSIMTNGLAIDDDIISFVNKYKADVSLSWDGDCSDQTRGFNIIEKNPRVLNIDYLWLAGVVSKYATLKSIIDSDNRINEIYKSIHGYPLRVHLNTVMKSYENEIFDIDLDLLRKEHSFFLTKDPETEVEYFIQNMHLYQAQLLQDEARPSFLSKCNLGIQSFVVNTNGDFYSCKNRKDIIGNIDDDFEHLLLGVMEQDECFDMIPKCKECNILNYCRGGCHHIKYPEHFCAVQKAVYEPLIEAKKDLKSIERRVTTYCPVYSETYAKIYSSQLQKKS